MDTNDLNPLDYINKLFPNEQSLSHIDDVIAELQFEYDVVDNNVRNMVCGKSIAEQNGRHYLIEVQHAISYLHSNINYLRTRTENTEKVVKEITAEIQQMDIAKKNLCSAIGTLNHLQLLVEGTINLKKLVEQKSYKDILNPLEAVLDINQRFEEFQSIKEINTLSATVFQIKAQLSYEILTDFKDMFVNQNQKLSPGLFQQLSYACKIVSIINTSLKTDLLKCVAKQQLEEYQYLFSKDQEISWLGKIDKRFSWFRKQSQMFEQTFLPIFPKDWKAAEAIAVHFCQTTRNHLSSIMAQRTSDIDSQLLIFALNKTQAFERELEQKFDSEFRNVVGVCFTPYLNIIIKNFDSNLAEMFQSFIETPKELQGTVLSSSGDLFVFFRKCTLQVTQLNNKDIIMDLSKLFKKYLTFYVRKILEPILMKTRNFPKSNLAKDFHNISQVAEKVMSNFVSTDDCLKFTKSDLKRICCVLSTADYCSDTILQLENKLKTLNSNIEMSHEKELLNGIISNCTQLLVQNLELLCDAELTTMHKIQWKNMTKVGDQSGYISGIIRVLEKMIPIIRENLSSAVEHFQHFCHKFIEVFTAKVFNNLYKCRFINSEGLINIFGCEQLLLDLYTLKMSLLKLPSIGLESEQKCQTSFTNIVLKNMTRAEMLIKIVMIPSHQCEYFNMEVIKLLPNVLSVEYQKILEMKSIRKCDQSMFVESFKNINKNKQV